MEADICLPVRMLKAVAVAIVQARRRARSGFEV